MGDPFLIEALYDDEDDDEFGYNKTSGTVRRPELTSNPWGVVGKSNFGLDLEEKAEESLGLGGTEIMAAHDKNRVAAIAEHKAYLLKLLSLLVVIIIIIIIIFL